MKKLLINLILFIIAIITFSLLVFPSFVYATFYRAFHYGFRGLKIYISGIFITVAEDLDRSGNFIAGDLLNRIFINKHHALYIEMIHTNYDEVKRDRLFGDIKETVSSVLGKNQQINNLTVLGHSLCRVLDRMEKNHCNKSIKWYKRDDD